MRLKPLRVIAIILSLLMTSAHASANIIERELQTLDNVLVNADTYINQHLEKIERLNELLQMPGISLENKYETYKKLYQEYEVFQFNKALEMLNLRYDIAVEMRDKSKQVDTELDKAQLYTISGMFTNVDNIFSSKIDTLALTPSQLTKYYFIQQRYYRNIEWKTGYAKSEQETSSPMVSSSANCASSLASWMLPGLNPSPNDKATSYRETISQMSSKCS